MANATCRRHSFAQITLLLPLLPGYEREGKSYLTLAVGCTGGRHRSPYVVEQLARRFAAREHVLARHRGIARP